MKVTDLKSLSPEEFENLTFDLLSAMGFGNLKWRTPGRDVGRDIEGEYFFTDAAGFSQKQRWYVDCKKYDKAVDWPTIWKKLSYADVQVADVMLIVVSSSASPQAIDQVNEWNKSKRIPCVRILDGADICQKMFRFPLIAAKFGFEKLSDSIVSEAIYDLSNVLRRSVYSLCASHEMGVGVAPKIDLVQSISELIDKVISDIKLYGKFAPIHYVHDHDGARWVQNGQQLDEACFDKYALNSILSFVRVIQRGGNVSIDVRDGDKCVKCSREIDAGSEAILSLFALHSNFHVRISDDRKECVFLDG